MRLFGRGTKRQPTTAVDPQPRGTREDQQYGTPNYWRAALSVADKARKLHAPFDRWNEIERYYLHRAWTSEELCQNTIYMFGRSLVPALLFRPPLILNTPRRAEFTPYAQVMDALDAWLVDEMEVEEVHKQSALSAYLFNIGVVEVGFDPPEGITGQVDEKTEGLSRMGVFPVELARHDRARRQGMPWLDCVPARQFLIDPLARGVRQARWYAKSMFLPTRVLKRDKTLHKAAVEATHAPPELGGDEFKRVYQDCLSLESYTHFYEIHDAENGTVVWMTETGKFLFDPAPDPMQVDGLPVTALVFNQNPDSLWGTSDAMYIESLMIEGNEAREYERKARKARLPKFIIDSEMLTEEEQEKIFAEDVVGIRVRRLLQNRPLNDGVVTLTSMAETGFIPHQEHLYEDQRRILGFGVNRLGDYAPGRRTAREVLEVKDANELRIVERRYMVAKQISEAFRFTNQLVQKYWNEEMVLRVLGVDGAYYFVAFRPSDVKAELTTRVDVNSLTPPSPERTKAELSQLMQVIANTPGGNARPILQRLLSQYPDLDAAVVMGDKQPRSLGQFNEEQNQMSERPETGARMARNVKPVANVLDSMTKA